MQIKTHGAHTHTHKHWQMLMKTGISLYHPYPPKDQRLAPDRWAHLGTPGPHECGKDDSAALTYSGCESSLSITMCCSSKCVIPQKPKTPCCRSIRIIIIIINVKKILKKSQCS